MVIENKVAACAHGNNLGFGLKIVWGGHEISKFSDGNSNGNLLHESPQV